MSEEILVAYKLRALKAKYPEAYNKFIRAFNAEQVTLADLITIEHALDDGIIDQHN